MTRKSWNEYQNDYRKSHYKQISAHLDPELVDSLKKKLKKDNMSFSDFIRKAIYDYLYLGTK